MEKQIRIKYHWQPTKLQQKLLDTCDSPEVRQGINKIIRDYANHFVPYKNPAYTLPLDTAKPGALREDTKVTDKTITWNMPYARYQYYGKVYAPNVPIFGSLENGGKVLLGFRSFIKGQPKPITKYPTNRKLNYTTPGTGDYWIKRLMYNNRAHAYMNKAIVRYLRKEMK